MQIRRLSECEEFIGGDKSILREFLHPDKGPFKINYSLAHATVRPGDMTKPHRLISSEVYCILEGEGKMSIDDETEKVRSGDVIYIPPGSMQYIENISDADLTLLCIVDPPWRAEDEEILGNSRAHGA